MGIYGQGNAFNLSFGRQRPMAFGAVPTRRMAPPPPMGSFTQTTNVNIKNGPSGFWGFMGGLMGGLTGTNMFGGGLFGMGGMSPFGMGMSPFGMGMGGFNTGINSGVYGMLNGASMQGKNPAADAADHKANLEAVFSGKGYKVIDNKDGTFSLTKGDGTVDKTGSYADLIKGATTSSKSEGAPAGGNDDKFKDYKPQADGTYVKDGQAYQKVGDEMKPMTDADWKAKGYEKQTDGTYKKGNDIYKLDKGVMVKQAAQQQGTPVQQQGTPAQNNTPQNPNAITKDNISTLVKKDATFSIQDDLNGNPISGFKVTDVSANNDKGFPAKITSTRNGKTITLEFAGIKDDGTAMYSAGPGTNKQQYRLEKNGSGFYFVQHNGDKDEGVGRANWHGIVSD